MYSENSFSRFYESLTKILSSLENSTGCSQNIKIISFLKLIFLFLQDFFRSQIFFVLFSFVACSHMKHSSSPETQKVKEPMRWFSHFDVLSAKLHASQCVSVTKVNVQITVVYILLKAEMFSEITVFSIIPKNNWSCQKKSEGKKKILDFN